MKEQFPMKSYIKKKIVKLLVQLRLSSPSLPFLKTRGKQSIANRFLLYLPPPSITKRFRIVN